MADFSKDTYKKALAAVLGIETIAGRGPTGVAGRKALDSAMRGFVRGGSILVRQAPKLAVTGARAGLGLGRLAAGISPQGLALLGGLTVAEAYQRGLLDEPIQTGADVFEEAVVGGLETIRPFVPKSGPPEGFQGFGRPKRKTSKYNRAVKAGMAAVKNSKFNGKKGTISNAKTTFARVNKVASAVNKGKKVGTKGVTGVIKRAVGRFL